MKYKPNNVVTLEQLAIDDCSLVSRLPSKSLIYANDKGLYLIRPEYKVLLAVDWKQIGRKRR